MGHPNLTPEVNRAIAQSEIEGGVFLGRLSVGAVLHVRTKNTSYTIEKRAGKQEGTMDYFISGNTKYCPEPTLCCIHGSTWGGSMLKMGFIGRGMHLEFVAGEHPGIITTSEIQDITEVQ